MKDNPGHPVLENVNLEVSIAISKGQLWQPVNCPLSLGTNISGLEDWGKMLAKLLEKRPCQSKTHSGLSSVLECQISVKPWQPRANWNNW